MEVRKIERGETCGHCGEKIKVVKGKLLFYSRHLSEYMCNQECLDNRYSDYMGTTLIDLTK